MWLLNELSSRIQDPASSIQDPGSLFIAMLSQEQQLRYSRQILLPEIGESGQEKLGASRVLIAGLGGLGSLSSLYMSGAGVGTLRIADNDVVSLSDLNRQILYTEADLGRIKTGAAAERLRAFNGSCRLEPLRVDICEMADKLLEGCDLVIDATDNMAARRALNRAAIRRGVPMVHGGVDGFSGSVTVILPGKSACFECLFPDRGSDPGPRKIPALGPVVGLVASAQCTEVLKLLLALGTPMSDRMLVIEAGTGIFKTVQTRKNPNCTLCASL
jgi:adenylyltransferase/sulfurtransferase